MASKWSAPCRCDVHAGPLPRSKGLQGGLGCHRQSQEKRLVCWSVSTSSALPPPVDPRLTFLILLQWLSLERVWVGLGRRQAGSCVHTLPSFIWLPLASFHSIIHSVVIHSSHLLLLSVSPFPPSSSFLLPHPLSFLIPSPSSITLLSLPSYSPSFLLSFSLPLDTPSLSIFAVPSIFILVFHLLLLWQALSRCVHSVQDSKFRWRFQWHVWRWYYVHQTVQPSNHSLPIHSDQ